MDPSKMIEMNNLRVLNDYLNQTIDVLCRGQRFAGNGHSGLGFSPFPGTIPSGTGAIGTDTVYGPNPYGYGSMFGGLGHASFGGINPFTGLPMFGGGFSGVDPFFAQRAYGNGFGGWQGSWPQGSWPQTSWSQSSWPHSWSPFQAQFTQALVAKQNVLEAMCRACGIPV